MEIIKAGINVLDVTFYNQSAYNAVYDSSCNDIGCVCDDCVDGG